MIPFNRGNRLARGMAPSALSMPGPRPSPVHQGRGLSWGRRTTPQRLDNQIRKLQYQSNTQVPFLGSFDAFYFEFLLLLLTNFSLPAKRISLLFFCDRIRGHSWSFHSVASSGPARDFVFLSVAGASTLPMSFRGSIAGGGREGTPSDLSSQQSFWPLTFIGLFDLFGQMLDPPPPECWSESPPVATGDKEAPRTGPDPR